MTRLSSCVPLLDDKMTTAAFDEPNNFFSRYGQTIAIENVTSNVRRRTRIFFLDTLTKHTK